MKATVNVTYEIIADVSLYVATIQGGLLFKNIRDSPRVCMHVHLGYTAGSQHFIVLDYKSAHRL